MAAQSAWAQAVYTWKDEKGVTHYETEPSHAQAKQAELPPIMRGEVKIPNLKKGMSGCEENGGVSCAAGADIDGSVICADGFAEVAQQFTEACEKGRLEIADITEVDPDGNFSIFLRNVKAAEAKQPKVRFKPEGSQMAFELPGPQVIEAYGLGEFKYNREGAFILKAQPRQAEFVISCANCR